MTSFSSYDSNHLLAIPAASIRGIGFQCAATMTTLQQWPETDPRRWYAMRRRLQENSRSRKRRQTDCLLSRGRHPFLARAGFRLQEPRRGSFPAHESALLAREDTAAQAGPRHF